MMIDNKPPSAYRYCFVIAQDFEGSVTMVPAEGGIVPGPNDIIGVLGNVAVMSTIGIISDNIKHAIQQIAMQGRSDREQLLQLVNNKQEDDYNHRLEIVQAALERERKLNNALEEKLRLATHDDTTAVQPAS